MTSPTPGSLSPAQRAALIDHTLLAPTATHAQIAALCAEADELGMASVCVPPVYVTAAATHLADSPVNICTVIDFPHGHSTALAKAAQAAAAVKDGADEVDMVISLGAVKEGDWDAVQADVHAVKEACTAAGGALLKVILETCLLTDEEITRSCLACEAAGADYVKTSTGFSTGGAAVHAVEVMHAAVGGRLGVKASGGVHSAEELDALVAAGATRIGASAGRVLLGEEVSA